MSHPNPRIRPDTHRRVRDRAHLEGLDPLADSELLALVVARSARGKSAGEIAASLLEAAGGIEGLWRMGPGRVADTAGLGPASALRVAAALELGKRVQQRRAGPRRVLATPEAVAASYAPRLGSLDHEQMWVLSLDGRNRLRGARKVAQGGMHGLSVCAREILSAALADGASGIVLVHNHPSGSPQPSDADVQMTRAVAAACRVVGIPLLDHVVVVANGEFTSMLEAGLIDEV